MGVVGVSEAIRLSTMLRDLADVLIPGEGDAWPSASLAGVHGILGMRLLEELGEDPRVRAVVLTGAGLKATQRHAELAGVAL